MRIFLAWPVLVLCLLVASPCPAEVKVLRFGVNEDPYFRRPFTALYKEVNRHLKNIRIELVPLPGERTIVELAESRLDGGAVRAMGFKAMYKGVDLPNVFQLRNPLMKAGFYLVGMYGAYALGANNVANTTGVFLEAGMLSPFMAALIGIGLVANPNMSRQSGKSL